MNTATIAYIKRRPRFSENTKIDFTLEMLSGFAVGFVSGITILIGIILLQEGMILWGILYVLTGVGALVQSFF